MPNLLTLAGAQPQKAPRYVPIFMDREFTGIYTQRSVLHDPSDFVTARYYGGRPDALWMGSNIELTNRLTLQRRPGLTEFSVATYPTAPLGAYAFERDNGTIQVIVDCGPTGSLALSAVDEISGVAYYHFTSTESVAANNAFLGWNFTVTGFDMVNNNGTFVCTGSTSSYLILQNTLAVTDTAAASASSTGAVYYDEQNNGPTYALSAVDMISGIAYYHFTSTTAAAASNGFEGQVFTITGFDDAVNNGTYACTFSNSSYMVLDNPNAITDTHSATAQSTDKILLFGKNAGAGQTFFVAVAGILYMGDGVDERKYVPDVTNLNPFAAVGASGQVWNWGGVAPASQPAVDTVESGSAATPWEPNTVFSTMGLLLDSKGHAELLVGVNATGANSSTTLGTSGSGAPPFSTILGGSFSEGTTPDCTWTCWGQISLWTADTEYSYEQPIWDPTSNIVFQSTGGKSGNARPIFKGPLNTHTSDANGMQWQAIAYAAVWQPNFTYHAWWEHAICGVCYPVVPTVAILTPSTTSVPNQPIYFETNNDQTTGSNDQPGISGSGYTPAWPNQAGLPTTDNELQWVDLGTATWAPATEYYQWSAGSAAFSVVEDPYGDFQVCITSGQSASGAGPYAQWQASHVYNTTGINNGVGQNSTYIAVRNGAGFTLFKCTTGGTSGASQPASWDFASGHTTSDNGIVWTSQGTFLTSGVWGQNYGSETLDGTVTWSNVGPVITWTANTQWYLQQGGFAPPTASQPYGGAQVIGNGYVQTVTATGESGSTQPTWPSAAQTYTLASVANASGQTAVYTGTIVAPANSLVGFVFTVTGFVTNPGNNGTGMICTANNGSTTITLINPNAIAESHSATATCSILGSNVADGSDKLNWYTEVAFSANSVAWTSGYVYAYSFYSRLADDIYNTTPPPGFPRALGTPTGSETGTMTTASPVFTITGSNTGAVNNLSGIGPTDPQFDTIVIWRSADGGGADNMFFLTEIPAPAPQPNGTAGMWTFQDYLPDDPTSVFPGLNELISAPINDQNDPPPSGFLPMVYNFNRIWGASGQTIYNSGGPDIEAGQGNPNEAFNPDDEYPFLANVTNARKCSQGIVVFLTDSIQVIAGGPATSSFYTVEVSDNIGLTSPNALDQYAGEIYFFAADSECKIISVNLQLSNAGFPIGDKLANFNAANVYVAVQQAGVDNAIYVTDGSTGWYRCNPHQTPGGYTGPEPIWSPFANITNGCQMVQSIEVTPGIKKLLVGATPAYVAANGGAGILERNLGVYTDNGEPYDAYFVMGSIMLCHPGQLCVLKFLEMDFSGYQFQPTISYLLNEISGTFTQFTLAPQFDPPSLYGNTLTPQSYSPNRYYFSGTGSLARARHLQIMVDFGTTSNGDEMYNLTIFGRLLVET